MLGRVIKVSIQAKVIIKIKVVYFFETLCVITAVNISLRFNGHFPGEPGLAGVY